MPQLAMSPDSACTGRADALSTFIKTILITAPIAAPNLITGASILIMLLFLALATFLIVRLPHHLVLANYLDIGAYSMLTGLSAVTVIAQFVPAAAPELANVLPLVAAAFIALGFRFWRCG